MPRQLAFDLPGKPALGRENFFVAPSNALAVSMLKEDWPGHRLLLVGPPASGKTHLAHVWAAETNASVFAATDICVARRVTALTSPIVIEDIHEIADAAEAEEELFHILNIAAASKTRLLLTSAVGPATAGFRLPDLTSRLQGTASAALLPPDDALLAALLVKLFRDRQIDVTPDLVEYLLRRGDRSMDAMRVLVERLDKAALAEGRALTRRFAARILDISS